MATKRPTLRELGDRISEHLKRFEADKGPGGANAPRAQGARFWNAGAWFAGGPKLRVVYVSYQGRSLLTRDEAERYLAKLDAGFVGRHFEALREAEQCG